MSMLHYLDIPSSIQKTSGLMKAFRPSFGVMAPAVQILSAVTGHS